MILPLVRLSLVALGAGVPSLSSIPSSDPAISSSDLEWNAETVEHLLNRAAFGAAPEEIARYLELGPEATVDELLGEPGSRVAERFGPTALRVRGGVFAPEDLSHGPQLDLGPPEATSRNFYLDRGLREETEAVRAYCSDWVASMLDAQNPVRDRMALFWHGHFVSEFLVVEESRDMIAQARFLHAHALENFDGLVRGMARDPAMLDYLNNNVNVKTHPNENWARELMELFTLGEGRYTEDDIKEAARAFTGWSEDKHRFVFNREEHDYGPKTVLGVTGNLDGGDVIDIALAREDCGLFLAEKIITYFEGMAPSAERRAAYARALREGDYHIGTFLRRLFLDPEFYRDEVRGTRISAPVEYFVGTARRLGIAPPRYMIFVASSLLGQRLFDPPNVKGWEEGMAWMTTGSIMQRSNLVGAMFGILGREEEEPARSIFDRKVAERGREFTVYDGPYLDYLAMLAWYQLTEWQPQTMGFVEALAEAKPEDDEELVRRLLDRLLAVPAPPDSVARVTAELASWRMEMGGDPEGSLLRAGEDATPLLVRLAHVIVSLPEAQLN